MASTINATPTSSGLISSADNSGVLALQTGGTTAVTIDASQKVGIGTASPTGKLQVSSAGGVSGSSNLLYVDVTSSYGGISVNSTANNNSFIELLEAGTKVGGYNADTTANVTSFQSAGGHALAFNVENTTEVGRFDTSANFKFNSGYGSVATAYGCRAWVNFIGSGTVAIRASGNVSSVTDLNTGYYRVNFTNAMPDTNYAVVGTSSSETAYGGLVVQEYGSVLTTGATIYTTANNSSSIIDMLCNCVAFFR